MRHLNDALILLIVAALIMLAAAAVTVRWLLARKEKRKSRGAGHWIDVGARAEGSGPRARLGSDDEPR